MGEIELIELGKCCEVIAGQSPPSSTYNQDEDGIPFFQGKADFGVLYPTVRYWCNKPKKMSKPNDILFSLRAPVGPTNINRIDACIGRGLAAIRCKDVDMMYLLHFLRGNEDKIASLGTGSTFKAIKVGVLKDIKIPLPPLETQKKIASILDAADAYRQKTIALIAKYDELTQSLFLEMFGEYLSGDLVPLGDFVNFSQGQQFGVELQSLEPKDGYARFLRIVDFTQGDDFRFVPNKSEKYYVRKDDIVIVRYGASAGFVGTHKEGVLANNLFKVNYDRGQFNQLFLFFLFKHGRFKSFIKREAFGAAMPALSFKVMARFEIPTPPLELQNQFAERVQKIEKQKAQAQESLEKAEELFNSLMQKAFKGEMD